MGKNCMEALQWPDCLPKPKILGLNKLPINLDGSLSVCLGFNGLRC
jgi:hypothetical protein